MTTWADPELGLFRHEEYAWCREIDDPKLMAFQYSGFKPAGSKCPVYLMIEASEENDIPTDDMVAVARRTMVNLDRLMDDGLRALIDDFHGRSPDSGMWWHADINNILNIISSSGSPLASLDRPEDLYLLMGQPSILIQEYGYGYNEPCAIIGFEAQFEVEHGVGLLTDGEQILGTGYRADVSPFGR